MLELYAQQNKRKQQQQQLSVQQLAREFRSQSEKNEIQKELRTFLEEKGFIHLHDAVYEAMVQFSLVNSVIRFSLFKESS